MSLDYVNAVPANTDAALWNDRWAQDDGDPRYHSRASHAEYMRRNDLALAGDFANVWRGAETQRRAIRKGADPARRAQIWQAMQRGKR